MWTWISASPPPAAPPSSSRFWTIWSRAAKTALRLEPRFDGDVVDALTAAGHDIDLLEPYSDVMGHAGAAVLHKDGSCEGAHDPRADGGAAGL